MKQSEVVGRRIKLQHLKVLMAVARQGSMVKAGKQLAISQPVVSKVIAELEEMLGVGLFDRTRQGVEPTLYGRALLKHSIAVFDDLRTGVDEIGFLADPTAGELRIGSTDYLIAGFGAAVMELMWQRSAHIAFQVLQGTDSATLLDRDLPERRIELALVSLRKPPVREDLETTILFENHLCVVAGTNSRWAKRRRLTLADLRDEPWCLSPTPIGSLIAEAFHASGLEAPRVAVATASAQLALQMIESGRFVGHFGDKSLHFFTDRFKVKKLPIDLPVPPFKVAIITLKNRTLSPLAQLFIRCARGVAAPLAKRQSSPAGKRCGQEAGIASGKHSNSS